jgi:release factor glutamine methyltransferase
VGVDRALGAAQVTLRNARGFGLEARCGVIVGDWDEALSGKVGVIVSNPPYIRRSDIAGLDSEVREHDPILALNGGDDGFAGHRAVLGAAERLLSPDGLALIEVGFDQAKTLAETAERLGWRSSLHPDLRGVSRVVELARR